MCWLNARCLLRQVATSFVRSVFGVILLVALANPAQADRTVTLDFSVDPDLASPEALRVSLVPDRLPDPRRRPEALVSVRQFTDPLALQVAAGRWRIELSAAGYWLGVVRVPAGEEDLAVEVDVLPTAMLSLKVLPPRNEALPIEASAFFTLTENAAAAENMPRRGSLPCRVEVYSWLCPIPTKAVAARLNAEGFVPHFWTRSEGEGGAVIDAGVLQLRRGAVVAGQVSTADGSPLDPSCRITAGLQVVDQTTDQGRPAPTWSAVPDPRGNFIVQGLLAGTYSITALQVGSAPARASVIVRADRQELDRALILRATLNLEVAVSPATGPDGEPWQLILIDPGKRIQAQAASTGAEGGHIFAGLEPGTYTVVVQTAAGTRLGEQTLDLGPEKQRLAFELNSVAVTGQLLLGGVPLAADLHFGGLNKLVSIHLRSDAEGNFAGQLPRAGVWDIDIRSHQPQIFRRLREVEVEVDPRTGTASLTLDLPGHALRGEVVDEEGAPVAGATLLLASREGVAHLKSQADGGFQFTGVTAGSYVLEAQKVVEGSRWQSAAMAIEVEPENNPWIRLEIKPARKIRGSVTSATGPVAGARIQALPLRDGGFGLLVAQGASDASGQFELELSAGGKTQLTIMAVGWPLHRETFEPDFSSQLVIFLSRPSGTLRLQHGGHTDHFASGRRPPWVMLDGDVRFDLSLLRNWARMNNAPSGGDEELVIPLMPSGSYDACWTLPAESEEARVKRCVEGVLLPGEELLLSLAEQSQ